MITLTRNGKANTALTEIVRTAPIIAILAFTSCVSTKTKIEIGEKINTGNATITRNFDVCEGLYYSPFRYTEIKANSGEVVVFIDNETFAKMSVGSSFKIEWRDVSVVKEDSAGKVLSKELDSSWAIIGFSPNKNLKETEKDGKGCFIMDEYYGERLWQWAVRSSGVQKNLMNSPAFEFFGLISRKS